MTRDIPSSFAAWVRLPSVFASAWRMCSSLASSSVSGRLSTGVFFGAYHLSITQLVPLSVLGIYMGFVVWASLLGVITVGTIAGSMLPFVLRSFRLDPATSSAPFVATLVDVAGLVIYFLVAKALLAGTVLQ